MRLAQKMGRIALVVGRIVQIGSIGVEMWGEVGYGPLVTEQGLGGMVPPNLTLRPRLRSSKWHSAALTTTPSTRKTA